MIGLPPGLALGEPRVGIPPAGEAAFAGRTRKVRWTAEDTTSLIALWGENYTTTSISAKLGRSEHAVRAKARRLALPQRARGALLRPLPLFDFVAPLAPFRWTQEREDDLADRWFSMQHHKAIAREFGVSPTTIASKAHRMELPRRDPKMLVQQRSAAVKAARAHLFAAFRKVRCDYKKRWFWTDARGRRFSRDAKRSATFRMREAAASYAMH